MATSGMSMVPNPAAALVSRRRCALLGPRLSGLLNPRLSCLLSGRLAFGAGRQGQHHHHAMQKHVHGNHPDLKRPARGGFNPPRMAQLREKWPGRSLLPDQTTPKVARYHNP